MENIEIDVIEGEEVEVDPCYYIGVYLRKRDYEGSYYEPCCTGMPHKTKSHCIESMKFDFERYDCKDARIIKVKFDSFNLK